MAEVGKELGFDPAAVTRLSESQFIMPGFVDTHTHAPQFVFTGTGYDERLLEWLQKYTFPVESRFANLDFARFNYERTVVCDEDVVILTIITLILPTRNAFYHTGRRQHHTLGRSTLRQQCCLLRSWLSSGSAPSWAR